VQSNPGAEVNAYGKCWMILPQSMPKRRLEKGPILFPHPQRNRTVACSCQKPRLLHLPRLHVIGAFHHLSEYFKKESIAPTWSQEVFGVTMFGLFT
jgi:hypothetical protein